VELCRGDFAKIERGDCSKKQMISRTFSETPKAAEKVAK
jgi:hypothetical protein